MVTRRPIVRVNGKNQQLPTGDVLAGVVQRLPVYQTDVAAVLIELSVKAAGAVLPVYQSSGALVEVPL